jgi:hypothetical protein
MRIKLWEKVALDRGIASVKKEFSKSRITFNQNDSATKLKISEAAKSRKFDTNYYHTSWLSFLYLGLPSAVMGDGSGIVCDTLKSGSATREMNKHVAVKEQRKQNTGALIDPKDPKNDNSNKNNVNVIVQIPRNEDQERQRNKLTQQMSLSNRLALSSQIFTLNSKIFELQSKIDDPNSSDAIRIGATTFKKNVEHQLEKLVEAEARMEDEENVNENI